MYRIIDENKVVWNYGEDLDEMKSWVKSYELKSERKFEIVDDEWNKVEY